MEKSEKRYKHGSALQKIMNMQWGFLEKLSSNGRFRLVFSVLLSLVLITIVLFTGASGETDDDWAISVALSGRHAYGGLCLFINAFLSHLIFFLNNTFSNINWFFAVEYFCVTVATASIAYASLTLVRSDFALFYLAVVLLFAYPGATSNSNFTCVAYLLSIAGFLLLLINWKKKKFGIAVTLLGISLAVLGFMWRRNAFILGLPFIAIALCFMIFFETRGCSKAEKNSILKSAGTFLFIPFLLVFTLCVVSFAYNNQAFEEPEWKEWSLYNQARSQISDYPLFNDEKALAEYKKIGVSENDLIMARAWMTNDPDFFTTEKLEQINTVNQKLLDDRSNIFSQIIEMAYAGKNYLLSIPLKGLIVAVLYFAFSSSFLSRQASKRISIFMCLLAFLLSMLFESLGRYPFRIESAVWIYCATGILIGMLHCKGTFNKVFDCRSFSLLSWDGFKKIHPLINCTAFVVSCLLAILFMLPSCSLKHFQTFFNQADYTPQSALIAEIEDHPETLNVWDTNTYYTVEGMYEWKYLPTTTFLQHNFFLGGWSSRSPYMITDEKQAGINNLVKDLLEKDSIVLVTADSDFAQKLLCYAREHYYPAATMEPVKMIRSDKKEYYFFDYSIR